MLIRDVITKIKAYHCGKDKKGERIDESKTRDQILYGDQDIECEGIVVTCFASVDVIRKAILEKANLIICHEALFWNHGDHTDWLENNHVFIEKKKILDEGKIVVWRDHDYIHSGIPFKNGYVDGIFYGVMKKLDWEKYLIGDVFNPLRFAFDEPINGRELIKHCINAFNLTGVRIVGDQDTIVRKVMIPGHIMGFKDNEILKEIEDDDYDCIISMEITDFTISEYIRDSVFLNRPRLIIEVGHFNTEEPGMEYMVEYVNTAIGMDIPVTFIKSADSFSYYL